MTQTRELRHTHRFEVETGDEPVRLCIGQRDDEERAGGHAAVPGGYAKVFNRLIDCGAWARLPDAGRAVYLPLARFADAREGFRTRAGLATLMKNTGLSRSSVKRGLKALQDAGLLVVVRPGGVSADGTNRSNVYQLLVPEADSDAESTRPTQSAARAKRSPKVAEGVQPRTPSRPKAEPRPGSPTDPAAGPRRGGTGAASGPPLRTTLSESHSPAAGVVGVEGGDGPESDVRLTRAAQSLQRWGVSLATARGLAERCGAEAVRSAVASAEPMARSGKLRNAAGFLVRSLEQGWSGPSAPAKAAGDGRSMAERERRDREAVEAVASRESADALLDDLDDATLAGLAERVVSLHAARPAMVRLLTAKPPRDSRLMRAEIAALLEA